MPVLEKILISDYRNIRFQELEFSPNINCITGNNGEGKTNLLDAVHYLSMTRSSLAQSDRFNLRKGASSFSISGIYIFENGVRNRFSVSVSQSDKVLKFNNKPYERLSDHIGVIPLVMVSPYDSSVVNGSGDDRRKFINMLLSQLDRDYLRALQTYNRLLQQRNALLKSASAAPQLLDVIDDQMAQSAEIIYNKRCGFISDLSPLVREFYQSVAGTNESIGMEYRSDMNGASLRDLLAASAPKDRAFGYTTVGVHRDELELTLADAPLRRCASQGEQKSFAVALKFAQYTLMKRSFGYAPIMLLDDLFDKLDTSRVSNLLKLVLGNDFGQIFITDCNKVRMKAVVDALTEEKAFYEVKSGEFVHEED